MFLVAAVSAYAVDNFGFVISADAFQTLVESNSNEMLDIFSLSLILQLTIMFIVPAVIIIKTKVIYPKPKTIVIHLLLCMLIISMNFVFFSKEYPSLIRNNRHLRYYINPIRAIYSLEKYLQNKFYAFYATTPSKLIEIDLQPVKMSASGKPKLVVLVVGESDRAMNHSLNGYSQNTNPLLTTRNDVYSFSKFYSCGTETLVSVPCMFSSFSRNEYTASKAYYTENILDLLQKANIEILWRDNDGGCKHVCDRVAIEDFNAAKIAPYCDSSGCYDEVLLHNLQLNIDKSQNDKLIILNKLGNHGPAYFKRYPKQFAKFIPTCDTVEIQKCSKQEIVNTYNNIILYTDYFLDKIIQQLENNSAKYQTALIYVSDHGESLGENGIYLHAMPYWLAPIEQTHIPFFFWASKDFDIDMQKVLKLQHQELSHDYIFHSLLGLFKVKSCTYNNKLDLFS